MINSMQYMQIILVMLSECNGFEFIITLAVYILTTQPRYPALSRKHNL